MNAYYDRLPYWVKCGLVSGAAVLKNRKKYGPDFRTTLDFLLSSSGEEQLRAAQERLATFLQHVRKTSAFYEVPEDLDLAKIPIITKADVLRNGDRIRFGKPYVTIKSSGTTGRPLAVPYTREAYQKEYAFWWYHRSIGGIRRGDRVATFAGHKVTYINRGYPPFWVYNRAERQLIFSSYHFAPSTMAHYVAALNRFEPDFIHGYPSSLFLVARYILDESIEMQFRPKMIVGGSEATLDYQREVIEKAFGARMYIWYGNTEYCGHITECRSGKLHVQPFHSRVRVVDDGGSDVGPGNEGRIVGTNFTNTVFPLINYDTKDVVRLSMDQQCDCGQVGLVVDYIVGRAEDYIHTADGRLIGRLDHLFKDAEHVRNAQIEQRESGAIIVRVEKDALYTTAIEDVIRTEAKKRLGDEMRIEFEYISEIPKNENGKFQFIVQRMQRDAG